MLFMLDTNICIYLIKKRSEALLGRMRAFSTGELGVSAVTVAELQYGVAKSAYKDRNQAALAAFLLPFDIAELTVEVAVIYGETRAELEKRGLTIGPLDTMIAAHALTLDVPLVTNNTREFERIKDLRIENWIH